MHFILDEPHLLPLLHTFVTRCGGFFANVVSRSRSSVAFMPLYASLGEALDAAQRLVHIICGCT